jgi:hypothetical protein
MSLYVGEFMKQGCFGTYLALMTLILFYYVVIKNKEVLVYLKGWIFLILNLKLSTFAKFVLKLLYITEHWCWSQVYQ